jgi:hypothetical protein
MELEQPPISAKIGARIRTIRRERGMTQDALATATGISRSHLSAIERGLVDLPVDVFHNIATQLGVQPMVLVLFPEDDQFMAMLDRIRKLPPIEKEKAIAELREVSREARAGR